MKIVVPTDFSHCSKIAARFAVGFARQVQAELILLHVLPEVGPVIGRMPSTILMQQVLAATEKHFARLEAEIAAGGLAITHRVAYGAGVENALEPYIQTHGIDLVIMGSKGASGIKKLLLGSNTVDVINRCSVPVIAVPEHIRSTPITHLVYASDLKNPGEEVEALLPLAQRLQAAIKIIHIPPPEYLELLDTGKLLRLLRQQSGYQAIELELLPGEDIAATIEHYVASGQGEMLAMFTRQTSFLEQLFRHSLTRQIAWQNNIPLLVINNRL